MSNEKGPDGGILPIGTVKKCDVCVYGMALNFSSFFLAKEENRGLREQEQKRHDDGSVLVESRRGKTEGSWNKEANNVHGEGANGSGQSHFRRNLRAFFFVGSQRW